MLSINVCSKKINFELSLEHKISYIVGDSASGKTRLVNALIDTSGAFRVNTSTNVRFVKLTSNNWDIILSSNSNKNIVYLVDDEDFIKRVEFGTVINTMTDVYFLFVIRSSEILADSIRQSVYSVHTDAIYELFEVNKGYYKCTCRGYTKEYVPDLEYSIIVEDESSGFMFFSKLCGNAVLSGHGRDNIMPWLRETYNSLGLRKDVLLIIDYSAAGFRLQSIKEYLECKGHSVYIVRDYESFEYMLLKSNMFKDLGLNFSDYLKYTSHEDMYTNILESITKGALYSYKKGNLKRCYMEDCCTLSRKDFLCDRGMHGDKMQALLKDTAFGKLLSLRKGADKC